MTSMTIALSTPPGRARDVMTESESPLQPVNVLAINNKQLLDLIVPAADWFPYVVTVFAKTSTYVLGHHMVTS